MAQHDYEILNGSGLAVRNDINEVLKAILTLNAGGSEPSTDGVGVDTPIAYMVWVDTQPSPNVLKIRNSSNNGWITLCEVASGGIGTIASGQFYIGDGTINAPGLAFKDDVDTGLRRSSSGDFSIVVGADRKLTVDTSGNVGIGNNSPGARLEVQGGTNTGAVGAHIKAGNGGDTVGLVVDGDNETGDVLIKARSNGTATPVDTDTKFIVLGDGKVGIGVVTPTELLHVAGNIKTTGNIDIASGNITSGTPDLGQSGFDLQNDGVHKLARNTQPSSSVLKVLGAAANNNGGELRVKGDGDCENTNGNYDQISSDERLKENIVDASSQWEDIKGIRFRNFNYISNPNTRMLGCVAQELQQVCPSLIKTRPASEEEIADNSNTISQGDQVLSFKQIPLLLKAAKALQEAMERIETLEAKVAALEAGS